MLAIASFFGENANPGNGTGTLQMGTSTDMKTWNSVANWTSTAFVRDPSITLINGTFAVVHTLQNAAGSFGLMTSSFIGDPWISMSNVPTVLPIGTSHFTWAPEWFIDPANNSLHILFVASTSTDINATAFDFYEIHPTTNTDGSINLSTWSTPVQLLTHSPFANPDGHYRLDPYVVFRDSTYYLFYAQESIVNDPIGLASSTALLGTYTCIDDQYSITKGWHTRIEGPCVVNRQGTWWAYTDNFDGQFDKGTIYYTTSTDTWATWGSSTAISAPNWPQTKQGSIWLNGVENIGGTNYTYFGQTYNSIANNGTATNSVEYVWGQTKGITNSPDLSTAGLVTGGGNLSGYKGNTAARLGGG